MEQLADVTAASCPAPDPRKLDRRFYKQGITSENLWIKENFSLSVARNHWPFKFGSALGTLGGINSLLRGKLSWQSQGQYGMEREELY